MKHFRSLVLPAALLGVAALPGMATGARAQTMPATPGAKSEASEPLHYFPLKNVSPSLMAYWLDPNHNRLPNQLQVGHVPYSPPIGRWPDASIDGEKARTDLPLPASFKRAIAIDQRDLLAANVATGEDTESLRELIRALDQPLRQIEIEAQFIEIDKDELKKIDVDDSLRDGSGVGFISSSNGDSIRNSFTARLNGAIAANKAFIISAPRFNAANNVTAQLGHSDSSAIRPTWKPGQTRVEFPENKVWLNIKPTIDVNNSVTLDYRLFRQIFPNSAEGSGYGTIARFGDGDTFILRDPLLGYSDATKSNRESVVFVTVRIVR